MFGTGICEKHTSRDHKISRTENRCIYLKMGIFRYTTYGVRILFDGDPFAQSIPLTKILPRITSIHEKSQVVCTLGDRFTDICPTFSEREMFIDSGYNS
jgi:enterochelin esterase-like enzyme